MAKKMMKNADVYKMVADRIIEQLDKGIIPWHKPWSGVRAQGAVKRADGKPYSLMNQFLLNDGKDELTEWVTFNRCKKEGGRVNKGAKSKIVVFWKLWKTDAKDEDGHYVYDDDGNRVKTVIPLLRYDRVFNVKDTTLEPKWTAENLPEGAQVDDDADAVLSNYWDTEGIKVHNDKPSDKAFYHPAFDSITLPMREQFHETSEYYSTAFHETVHSTGHKSRLNRLNTFANFGSADYSKEELVAEMGASMLNSIFDLEDTRSFNNSVAYIEGWRNAIAKDNALVVVAAGKAEKAVERILNPEKPAK